MGLCVENKLDSKGRLVIPEEVRRRVRVRPGSKLKIRTKNESIILTKSLRPIDFIKALEGVLKKGSAVESFDPLRLKEIWLAN